MLPMNNKEYEKWSKVRTKGKIKYSIKTSLTATIVTFLIFVIGNAYVNLAHIDKYIAYNIGQAETLGLTLAIAFVALFVFSLIIYSVNDKRYLATNNSGTDTNA